MRSRCESKRRDVECFRQATIGQDAGPCRSVGARATSRARAARAGTCVSGLILNSARSSVSIGCGCRTPAFDERDQLLVPATQGLPSWVAVVLDVSPERGDGEVGVTHGGLVGQRLSGEGAQHLELG